MCGCLRSDQYKPLGPAPVHKSFYTRVGEDVTIVVMLSFKQGLKKRLLIYSYDSFGLGHLRRCRTIAHFLVERHEDWHILILSGSPVVGQFDFHPRVDFIRLPGMTKLKNGRYIALDQTMNTEQTLFIREQMIRETVEHYAPDVFLVDKEPLGLHGELKTALESCVQQNIPNILGLRDIMDDPQSLHQEWERKNVIQTLDTLYSCIFVYGVQEFYDPFTGLVIPNRVRQKVRFTGYLRRSCEVALSRHPSLPQEPFFLVTPGGGGDGEELVHWVLCAYEHDSTLRRRLLILFGPFMHSDRIQEFTHRACVLKKVDTVQFETHPEHLITNAQGIICMGGYNTFCEILSFNKPAVMVPRYRPRREQLLRARFASTKGLCQMLYDDGHKSAQRMACALHNLETQPPPPVTQTPGFLDGLECIEEHLTSLLAGRKTRLHLGLY